MTSFFILCNGDFMHVWQIVRNYLMDDKPVVCFSDCQVYFYLYQSIVHVDDSSCVVLTLTGKVRVQGKQLFVKQLSSKEMLIEGTILGVFYEV